MLLCKVGVLPSWNGGDQTRPRVCRAWPLNGACYDVALFSVSWSADNVAGTGAWTAGSLPAWREGETCGQETLVQVLFSLFPVLCDLHKSHHFSTPHCQWHQLTTPPFTTQGENIGDQVWLGTLAPLGSEPAGRQGCWPQRAPHPFGVIASRRVTDLRPWVGPVEHPDVAPSVGCGGSQWLELPLSV